VKVPPVAVAVVVRTETTSRFFGLPFRSVMVIGVTVSWEVYNSG